MDEMERRQLFCRGGLGYQSIISKSQVSRIYKEIGHRVQVFLSRHLQDAGCACVYLDSTHLKSRLGKTLQISSRADVVAMGANADVRGELLGLRARDRE